VINVDCHICKNEMEFKCEIYEGDIYYCENCDQEYIDDFINDFMWEWEGNFINE